MDVRRTDQVRMQLTLFIYMDGLCGVLTENRDLLAVENYSFASINSQDREVQTSLDQFYSQSGLVRPDLKSINLVYVNSIFHMTKNGQLETYKHRLPAYLLYHKEFFDVPVKHMHVAQQLETRLNEWHETNARPALWFHLRNNILFLSFCTTAGDISITSFEVQKTLDVYYYILFNYQTLQPVISPLDQIIISGELVNMDKIHNFFEENIPEKKLTSFWQWKGIFGKPNPRLNVYLPEVNI